MYTVPVLIDDIKTDDDFRMTRCTYLAIRCDGPSPDWTVGVGTRRLDVLMMSLSGVVQQPVGGVGKFRNKELIDRLFEAAREEPGLRVSMNMIWLPNSLFKGRRKGTHVRGSVFRISQELFELACDFRRNVCSLNSFRRRCGALKRRPAYSPTETRAFAAWTDAQIEASKSRYESNKRRALPYQEENAATRKGARR